jgi:hypothetical protein
VPACVLSDDGINGEQGPRTTAKAVILSNQPLTLALPMNPKMVGHTPHPGPLPIGSADAEREKRSLRPDDGLRRVVQEFKARIRIRRNLSPATVSACKLTSLLERPSSLPRFWHFPR